MNAVGAWFTKVFLTWLGEWLLNSLGKIVDAYVKKEQDESKNKEIKDGADNAQTPEDFQNAANSAAGRIGHN